MEGKKKEEKKKLLCAAGLGMNVFLTRRHFGSPRREEEGGGGGGSLRWAREPWASSYSELVEEDRLGGMRWERGGGRGGERKSVQ